MMIILYVFSVVKAKLISIMKLNPKKNVSFLIFCFVFLGGWEGGGEKGAQLNIICVDVAVIKPLYLRTSTLTKWNTRRIHLTYLKI